LDEDTDLLIEDKIINHAFRIGEDLRNRIEKQVKFLKAFDNRSYSIQMWINEAIKERFELEKNLSPEELGKEKYLSFRLYERISEKIESSVQMIRQFRTSFSKKQWFLEAFYEKLIRDEKKAKKVLKKMRQASKED